MATTRHVGSVLATIGTLTGGDPAPGPIDVTIVAGHVEISLGSTWAGVTETQMVELLVLMHKAWAEVRGLRLTPRDVLGIGAP